MAKQADKIRPIELHDENSFDKPGEPKKANKMAIDAAEHEGLPVVRFRDEAPLSFTTIRDEAPLSFTTIPGAELDSFIHACAYELFEQAGRQDGQAEEHWHQAQSEILSYVARKQDRR